MIQSLGAGIFLALLYSYCLYKESLRPVSSTQHWRFGGVIRVIVIGVIFLALAKFTALDISQVLIAFITVISFYLFKQAGGAIFTRMKAGEGDIPSHRRS